MKILNKTKGTILAQDVELANTEFKRVKGLLGKKELKAGQALIIKPCNSIHTFFMRFNIDVLFMDKNDSVVSAVSNIAPFRLSAVYFNAAYVIEFPAGVIQSSLSAKGDHIVLE